MEVDKSENWRMVDPCPEQRLDEIYPVSVRARALLARSLDHPVVRQNFLRIRGVVDMLGALDYHSSNIERIEASLSDYFQELEGLRSGRAPRQATEAEVAALQHGRYEAIAYVVSLGRVYYFARALNQLAGKIDTPTIDRLLVFRHKVGAHRSIDMPRGESPELQSLHALSLAAAGGQLLKPVPGGSLALQYQIQRDVGAVENFVPSEDHTAVMGEAYSVFERLLS